jgi:two-component system, cell cycle response regulator DivK
MPLLLVIDDDEPILALLEDLLAEEGFEVVCAHKGKTGLEIAQERLPALIVADIHLPDINGRDLIAEFKRAELTRRIPIIATTALYRPVDTFEALPADDVILKPFDIDVFTATVRKWLKETRIRR